MGYLLFLDALGIQNYYNKGIEYANPVMDRIISTAKQVFGTHLPVFGNAMKDYSTDHLAIMNDTVFVYSNDICHLLFFASKFLKAMFIPDEKVDPIAFRGAIILDQLD